MKIIYIIIISLAVCIDGFSQTARPAHKKIKAVKSKRSAGQAVAPAASPRVTITEQYLNGTAGKNQAADTSALKNAGNKSPFAGGIHAAPNAGEKFDTLSSNTNNTNNGDIQPVTAAPVAASNDTVFNTNTIIENGTTTNSGAVDRSGQAQFGQTNWGNTRSTVGESQWTIPPPVTASFSNEFPSAGNLSWTKNNIDTSIYSARYKSGDSWVTANYNSSGQRLDTRTEVPLTLLPATINTYISKLPTTLPVAAITKWQVLGKSDVYEIKTKTGKTIYVSSDGTEVSR